jgi:hypothetical protein
MEIKNSYFVKLSNGVIAWLAIDKEIPVDATILEERPILIPSQGMVLKNVKTGEFTNSCWLKEDGINDWIEVEDENTSNTIDIVE